MRNLKRGAALAAAVFFTVSNISVLIFRWLPVPVTPLMLLRLPEQLFSDKSVRLQYRWVPAEEISMNMPWAVMASEDQLFMEHHGFDFKSIKLALQHNSGKSRRTLGASTISQQTARNVFLWQGRNWVRKGLEAYFTLLIELYWSKERILEVYLNVIEMGNGIYGAEAAAQHYYKHSAQKLSMNEAALIASVLPNPRKWNPAKPVPYVFMRQRKILAQMRNIEQPYWW